jgi:uncharacterized protein (TIGR04255 family)
MLSDSPYSRTPIVEALLDIEVELTVDFAVDTLTKCQKWVKNDYPDRKRTQHVTGQISVGQKLSTSASTESAGYVFTSSDKTQIFQAKRTGFTFNRLAPYPGWDAFFAEAKRLWEVYRKVARPLGYKRVALRYIDRFDFPTPTVNMETYFRTYPEVSRDLPQMMAGFFLQFNIPIDDIQSVATVTQTATQPPTPEHSSIILDIDLSRAEALPRGNELWPLFETLRMWKNRIFEACITDSTRELIR